MKIIHVTHGFYPESGGGVESYVRTVVSAQRAEGHDARILTGSLVHWVEAGVEEIEVESIPVFRLHRDDLYFDHFAKLYNPEAERLIRALLAAEKPDVVHVHQWIRLTCNIVEICTELDIPAVVTLHDLYTSCPRCFRVRPGDDTCSRPLSVGSCLDCVPRFGHESDRELIESIELFRDQYRSELLAARSVLVADGSTADLIAESTGFDRARFELLPLAYEPRFPEGAPAPVVLPRDDEPFRFGYWGNLSYRKGTQVLLEAYRRLCATGVPRQVELHLFGAVDTEELDERLKELACGVPVRFHGRFEYGDLPRARLHMAVFPMLCFETYGFVLDESFELGLPAIVTDIGAMSSRAGDSAIRVPPKDPDALLAAMRSVLERPTLCDELRAHLPAAGLSTAAHLERLDAVYGRAISGEPHDFDHALAQRRARLLMLQRESAQARICPDGGPQ